MKSYVTTPIYYVNDVPHIGHAYTTIIADTMARYYRLKGSETFLLTGTDEHGQKIEQAAKARGFTPKVYADEISGKFKALWDDFDISYNHFIRTTDEDHKRGVQKAFEVMLAKGDIYKGEYEGFYCVSCETFFTETQLLDDGGCPDCGKPTSLVKEESYFFRLSNYQDKLLEWYQKEEKCVVPKGKKNEVISFVKQGLKDLSITRTSFDWGVKLPESMNDPRHVMYVWLDALLNYITALGYGKDEANMDYWPASVQLVGKDILRFHAIYWPAFLMSLGLPLPKHVAAHGWWTRNGEKMSKSKGNVVNPKEVADAYGLENFRFFLLREVPFGQDGDFSQKALIDRINSDLGNEFGNLLNRIIGMSGKYSNHVIDSSNVKKFYAKELEEAHVILRPVENYIQEVQTNRYLEELWKVLTLANQSITVHEPWAKIKEGKNDEALALVALVANLLAKVAVLLSPIMPKTCEKIAQGMHFSLDNEGYDALITQEALLAPFTIEKIPPLFPRIEEERMDSPEPTPPPKETPKATAPKETEGLVDVKEFFKSQLKIATIVAAEEVPKSAKLLKLHVDVGEGETRQIIAGIKEHYSAQSLVGTQVCIVANLKPAKIMGLESYGMLLAAKDGTGLCLMRPENPRENGASVG
ncbi:MAG: methionine--tRNA ligase [Campylobacterales bacterium]|nr:methionine--tRNA ligase [Campylobacterales bacterium]